jgi:hypothetical protein
MVIGQNVKFLYALNPIPQPLKPNPYSSANSSYAKSEKYFHLSFIIPNLFLIFVNCLTKLNFLCN